jgi:hypothetical protein
MPAGYEEMRDKFYEEYRKRGYPPKEAERLAKQKAARIWNSKHPNNPVTRKKD